MHMRLELLRKHGWRPIVSDAQATNLLRRELKHHQQHQDRVIGSQPPTKPPTYRFETLLQIKKGNWYKFVKDSQHLSILIRTPKPD